MKLRRSILVCCLILVMLFTLPLLGDPALMRELPLGWIGFLKRVLPAIAFNWNVIGMFALCLALIVGGTHYFCSWLSVSVQKAKAPDSPIRSWSWRWTGALLAAVGLPFFVGMAVIGIVHQTGWMLASNEPLRVARQDSFLFMFQADLAFRIAANDLTTTDSFENFRQAVWTELPRKMYDKIQMLVVEDEHGQPIDLIIFVRDPQKRAKREFLLRTGTPSDRQFLPPEKLPEVLKKYEGRLKAL